MGGSVFTHFLVLPSSSTPSLSTLFPSKFPTRPINESFPFTLTCNQFPSKLTTSRPSQFSAPPSYSCSVKKIKASGSQQTGSIRHGDNLDAMNSRSLLQTEVSEENANGIPFQQAIYEERSSKWVSAFLFGQTISVISPDVSCASSSARINEIYEVGELFDLSIQLIYLILLLGLLGSGTFFVIRQVLVRRELDLSAKELQEQVRSGDAGATELFELGAVMLRRKFYPAATKFLLQAIEKWDGDNPDLAQVYNALGVSYVRDGKVDKGIAQFETAVKLQPGYVTAWNNLGDAFESKKDYKSALKSFEEVLLFDPNNKVARPRRDSLKGLVDATKGVTVIKSTEKK
ncbi:hypothetical protein AAZX31_10G203900 [Glycine max]|uniref:tetratricopeptide repeat domain-containing protein PYG7, chloroplastic-like isoform X2 n=1 Tax=Glycine soja TaxID=3848 RepID=UPI001040277D|nr:tetratricopeptide repeat domain-containing protein PYG7, chloroplastic-like isoform X2 [Glycine soja]